MPKNVAQLDATTRPWKGGCAGVVSTVSILMNENSGRLLGGRPSLDAEKIIEKMNYLACIWQNI
jgi:hypothetical protein